MRHLKITLTGDSKGGATFQDRDTGEELGILVKRVELRVGVDGVRELALVFDPMDHELHLVGRLVGHLVEHSRKDGDA